ncbi:MAG: nitroreductase [Pseudomonadota bacterium]
MTAKFPPQPNIGKPMLTTRSSSDARSLLALRRSAGKAFLTDPGPKPKELEDILRVAIRVPDHRRVEPWRFIVFDGSGRAAGGEIVASVFAKNTPDATKDQIEAEQDRLQRAPVVIGVVSSPNKAHKTPVWEQELSVGAVCQNLLLAANAAGWAGVWLSEWICYDRKIASEFGLTEDERFAGFIYLGTPTRKSPERMRAEISQKITRWTT